jgi:glycosyltransferase involved in cell wall biosynthesis
MNYIFAGGRINSMKRQHLLIEALLFTNSNVKLIIAGPPDSPEDALKISELVTLHKLENRVKLDLRFLPREVYANYVNYCSAVAYLPYDEDALSYVAMEAAEAGKPLITLSDSGGILGLALNQHTGWVAEPNPKSIAEAMNEVFQNPNKTLKFSKAIKDYWRQMDINWPNTIEKILL